MRPTLVRDCGWSVKSRERKKAKSQVNPGWQKSTEWVVKDPDEHNRSLAYAMQLNLNCVTFEEGYLAIDLRLEKVAEKDEYPQEVQDYVDEHKLESSLAESRVQLRAAFNSSLNIRYMLVSDPEDGSDMLSVDILTPTAQVEDADARLSDFCYEWWYDYEGKGRGLMRFRVVESLAL